MKTRINLFFLLLLSLLYTPVFAQTINPLDYVVNEAKTGVARYEAYKVSIAYGNEQTIRVSYKHTKLDTQKLHLLTFFCILYGFPIPYPESLKPFYQKHLFHELLNYHLSMCRHLMICGTD